MSSALRRRPLAVLVEGRSDVVAVLCALELRGVRRDDLPDVISMGGVTNFRRSWADAVAHYGQDAVGGLCDAGEVGYLTRPLTEAGLLDAERSLDDRGFFVCNRDLEEELIRALGAENARAAVEAAGIGGAFAVLTRQPQWAGRDLGEQLHRFAGAGAGRKELLAHAWTAALTAETLPLPLAQLADWVAQRRI